MEGAVQTRAYFLGEWALTQHHGATFVGDDLVASCPHERRRWQAVEGDHNGRLTMPYQKYRGRMSDDERAAFEDRAQRLFGWRRTPCEPTPTRSNIWATASSAAATPLFSMSKR